MAETVGVLPASPLTAPVKNVTATLHNPFGFQQPCAPFVPGYGDANADFHVIGDNPQVHGGVESGIPFTGTPAAERFQRALVAGGLLGEAGTPPTVEKTYLSYLYMCGDRDPTDEDYADHEPMFDTEVRSITSHVLFPVGERATEHVFANMTSERPETVDMERHHATEVRGSGWLVYPVKEPTAWTDADESELVSALQALLATDYRQEAELGRFLPGDDVWRVR